MVPTRFRTPQYGLGLNWSTRQYFRAYPAPISMTPVNQSGLDVGSKAGRLLLGQIGGCCCCYAADGDTPSHYGYASGLNSLNRQPVRGPC